MKRLLSHCQFKPSIMVLVPHMNVMMPANTLWERARSWGTRRREECEENELTEAVYQYSKVRGSYHPRRLFSFTTLKAAGAKQALNRPMSRPRLELSTFCVLDRCDNQLRHRPMPSDVFTSLERATLS